MATSGASATSLLVTSFGATGVSKAMGSPPADSMALRTAEMMAFDVTVAPVTVSTARLWLSTIRPGMVFSAASERWRVSSLLMTLTSAIFPSWNVVDTRT